MSSETPRLWLMASQIRSECFPRSLFLRSAGEHQPSACYGASDIKGPKCLGLSALPKRAVFGSRYPDSAIVPVKAVGRLLPPVSGSAARRFVTKMPKKLSRADLSARIVFRLNLTTGHFSGQVHLVSHPTGNQITKVETGDLTALCTTSIAHFIARGGKRGGKSVLAISQGNEPGGSHLRSGSEAKVCEAGADSPSLSSVHRWLHLPNATITLNCLKI